MGKEYEFDDFIISRIKEQAFEIDESFTINEGIEVRIEYENGMNVIPEKNTIEITIDARFVTTDEKKHTVVREKALTAYYFQDFQKYAIKGTTSFNIPDEVLLAMVNTAVSHARAFLAKGTSGSQYHDLYIPMINPANLLQGVLGT